jgi:hypothetical protein
VKKKAAPYTNRGSRSCVELQRRKPVKWPFGSATESRPFNVVCVHPNPRFCVVWVHFSEITIRETGPWQWFTDSPRTTNKQGRWLKE